MIHDARCMIHTYTFQIRPHLARVAWALAAAALAAGAAAVAATAITAAPVAATAATANSNNNSKIGSNAYHMPHHMPLHHYYMIT